MKLLVDIGNTRIKWAFAAASGLLAVGEARHSEPTGLRALFATDWRPREIRVANVAGPVAGGRIAGELATHFGIAPVFAGSAASGAGVRNGYSDPRQLGIDRWLGICAAHAVTGAAACVVNAGTATTIDLVNGAGEHLGGLILPGIELMQSALFQGTGDLGRLAAARADSSGAPPQKTAGPAMALGRDTAAAIRLGAIQATATLVEACAAAGGSAASPGPAPRLILAGGAAPELLDAMGRLPGGSAAVRAEYRPHLVLEGLALEPPCFAAGACSA